MLTPKQITINTETEYPVDIPPIANMKTFFDIDKKIIHDFTSETPIRFMINYSFYNFEQTKYDIEGIYHYYPINGQTSMHGKKIITTDKNGKTK